MHTLEQTTLLLVDDEPNNVTIIKNDLEDEQFNVLTAYDGAEGWDLLQQNADDIKIILLDRMMPNMDGMEFMAKLKADSHVSHIPVVMQTAATEKQQMVEGIAAGVYYYLTKPYQRDMLLAVLQSALSESAVLHEMRQQLVQWRDKLSLVKESHFEIASLEEARHLTALLANHYPDADRATLGIWEMLINALEHGNAGISYHEKSDLLMKGTWEDEVARRLLLPECRSKSVHAHFKRHDDRITLTITDAGDGFDWKQYLEIDPTRTTHTHGRGIALASMMSFDSVRYNDAGNQVTCITNLHSEKQ